MDTNNTPAKIVAYYRVSTRKQSLGLDAQRAKVQAYAAANGLDIVAEIEEKESGTEGERPGIMLAMATARKNKATLVVAKADRLSRDIEYAARWVFSSNLDIVCVDIPRECMENQLMFCVHFGLAAQEAKMISDRTKAALAAAKANGTQLGRPGAEITPEMRQAAAAARKATADAHPANLRAAQELTRYFAGQAKRNLSAAARHLNEMQLYTARGVFHDAKSVKLLVQRYSI